jgi:hypothetical protein
MADGMGAPGAIAEMAAKGRKSAKKVISGTKGIATDMGIEAVNQMTPLQMQKQQNARMQQQQASSQMQQKAQLAKLKEAAQTPEEIHTIEAQLKALQSQNKQTTVRDGNGQNSVLATRLFTQVQGDLAYQPYRWGEDALERQKQEKAQKQQQEEMELQQKKQAEEQKKMETVDMPGSVSKLPGLGKKKPKQNLFQKMKSIITNRAQNKDLGRQMKG